MITPKELEEHLIAYVQLEGMGHDRERVAVAAVRSIVPAVWKLIRSEVIQAHAESAKFDSRELRS